MNATMRIRTFHQVELQNIYTGRRQPSTLHSKADNWGVLRLLQYTYEVDARVAYVPPNRTTLRRWVILFAWSSS